jgi:hypothetical protein
MITAQVAETILRHGDRQARPNSAGLRR